MDDNMNTCCAPTKSAKNKDFSIHVGQQLHRIYRCYTTELGQTVYVTNGMVEEISVFNGECRISIRWEYGACQCVGLGYIGTRVFLDRESANKKLFEAVENG